MEIERLSKQRYLTKEIINKGYDQLNFAEFLRQKKPSLPGQSAVDIDGWTFDELDRVV